MSDIRLTGRPVLGGQKAPVQQAVVARETGFQAGRPQPDAELVGFLQGLGELNPALRARADQMTQQDLEQATIDAKAAAEKQDLNGATPEAAPPVPALEGSRSPAYSSRFGEVFTEATAHRLGIAAKTQAAADYDTQKDLEDFSPETFLAERRAKLLGGVQDPRMAAIVGAHFREAEQEIMAVERRKLAQKREEARGSALQALTVNALAPDMDAIGLGEVIEQQLMPQGKDLQFDRKSVARAAFARVVALSEARGGDPSLFDAFTMRKDPATKLTMVESDAEFGSLVTRAREAAQKQAEGKMMEATESMRAAVLADIDNRIATAPESLSEDMLLSQVSKFGALPTAEAYASKVSQWRKAMRERGDKAALMAEARSGLLGWYDHDDQKKVLDEMFGATTKQVWADAVQGNPEAAKQVAAQVFQLHSQTGASVPVRQLGRLTESLTSTLPKPGDAPSPQFLVAVELYKSLGANPKYRATYFKDEQAQLMEAYIASAGSADPATAYQDAYRAIDPAAKKLVEERMKDPKIREGIRKRAAKAVTGSSFLPRWLGGNGRPENAEYLGIQAQREAERVMTRLGDTMTDSQLEAHLDSWMSSRFVQDETSGLAVKVPQASPQVQQAITAYSADVKRRLTEKGDLLEDAEVVFTPVGEEGLFYIEARNGSQRKPLTTSGPAHLNQILGWQKSRTMISDPERAQLGAVKEAIKAGQPLPALDPGLLEKARRVGSLGGSELAALEKAYNKAMVDRVASVPKIALGEPPAAVQPPRQRGKVDPKLTSQVAKEYADSAASFTGGSAGATSALAASLITMGEAVALTSYDDPNPDAGRNIGMGYNLKANAGRAREDLKRAGVPEERIDQVLKGEVELLPAQAKRLLDISLPRYSKLAEKAAEETAPGLWGRMLPSQRAVMIDVAWQTGDPDQFRKAWKALADNKPDEFAAAIKVFYSDGSGQKVEDKRRNGLRAAMLAGAPAWGATLARSAGVPSTKLIQ